MLKKIILSSAVCLLVGCASKPTTTKTAPVTAVSSDAVFFNKIKTNPSFQQVKISSRVNIDNGSFIPTLDATIYIENGRKVWMNMVALILNVGRGIATPEGIRGYEKWNKTYIESDFSYLNKLLNVNFIDFKTLENLLLGRTFVPVTLEDFKLVPSENGYMLQSVKNLKFGEGKNISEYAVTLQYAGNLDLNEVTLNNKKTGDQLQISYSNWQVFENLRLPGNVKISIKGDKPSQIFLENTKFDSSRMDTPYSVPNNYTKTEIK